MTEEKIIDLSKIIGVYPICNTGAVLLYEIDHAEDRVLAGINGYTPEWCGITEQDGESGFLLGSFFVPFNEVMRL